MALTRIQTDAIKDAITTTNILDGTIIAADISSGGVTPAKLSTGAPVWDTSNNLGIGTATPSQKLEVAGNIFINTSANPYLHIKTSGAGNNPYIRMTADTNYWDIQSTFSNATDDLYFMYNGTVKLGIDASGNPSFTPSANYSVLSLASPAGKAAYSRFNNGTNYSYFGVDDSTGSAFVGVANSTNIWNNGAYPIIISPGTVERLRVEPVTNGGGGAWVKLGARTPIGTARYNFTPNGATASYAAAFTLPSYYGTWEVSVYAYRNVGGQYGTYYGCWHVGGLDGYPYSNWAPALAQISSFTMNQTSGGPTLTSMTAATSGAMTLTLGNYPGGITIVARLMTDGLSY